MFRIGQMNPVKVICLFWLSWSCAVGAITLGSPKLLSKPGEPLKVEFPIRVGVNEQAALPSLSVVIANKALYQRLGISQKIIDLNAQTMIYRNQQQQLMVLVETVEPVQVADDPFLDILLTLNWSEGSVTKTYTLLLGDTQKILVRPGQTLSEIAAQLAPKLDGASLDQTMMALFKANPDAFASGSINRLEAGAELNRPNQALLRSISPAEAQQFVAESNAQWQSERESKMGASVSSSVKQTEAGPVKDRLKIGSSAESNSEERRYTEELVAQEKILEQTRTRIAELEKNIADLQGLLDKAKAVDKSRTPSDNIFGLGGFAPALLALALMAFTGLLLWLLAKNARKLEVHDFSKEASKVTPSTQNHVVSHGAMPDRAKALFAGIDLNLSPSKKENPVNATAPNPASDLLRVKLNLARAYITIEDFSAAQKSLQEVVSIGGAIDPAATAEAQDLLLQLSQRNN